MRMLFVLSVLTMVTIAGCKPTGNESTVKPGDAELVKQTADALRAMDHKRGQAMADAEGKLYPRADLGECPVKYETYESKSAFPSQAKEELGAYDMDPWDAGSDYDSHENFGNTLAAITSLGIAFGKEVATKPGPRIWSNEDVFAKGLKPRADYDRQRLKDAADKTKSARDYELIIDEEVAPKITSETEFEPGILRGRFYAWDYGKEEIVCMARILVLSSEKLRMKMDNEGSKKQHDEKWQRGMRSDLRERAVEQAKTRLFIAGPLPTDDDGEGATDSGSKDAGPSDAAARNMRSDAGKTGIRDAGTR